MFRPAALIAFLLALLPAQAQLRVCVENDWAPMAFAREGKPAGAMVDLAAEAFQAAGLTVSFESGSYNRCLALTRRGHYQAMLDVAQNSERQPQFIWPSQPLLVLPLHLIGSKPGTASPGDYSALRGLRVGMTLGYEYPDALLQQRLVRVVSPSEQANFHQLLAGGIDVMVLSAGSYQALREAAQLKEGEAPHDWGRVDELALYIAFHARHPQAAHWATAISQSLQGLQRSGALQRILQRWQARP